MVADAAGFALKGHGVMLGYEGPIEIPLIADSVSEAIRNFANERGFEFAAGYHDEPIWFVRKGDGSGFFRQVQVAAFVTSEGPFSLFFIPFAYLVENQSVRLTPPIAASNASGQVSSSQPTKGDKIPIAELMKLNPNDAVARIQAVLSLTWQEAALFQRQDAVY